jgi:hypothetical protein
MLFNVIKEFEEDFKNQINVGKEIIKNCDIGILSLTRNNGDKIYNNLLNIFDLPSKSKQFFIYENDSEDNTVDEIVRFKKNNGKILKKFEYESEKLFRKHYGSVKEKERTIRLAEYRNKCLSYAKENFSYTDYTIVIDLDFIKFYPEGLYSSFYWLDLLDADGMSGFSFTLNKTQIKEHTIFVPWNYDSWAYRENWWSDLQDYPYFPFDPMMWFGRKILPIGSPPYKVNSAFGGMAIYKTEKYMMGQYNGGDCEHVLFHKDLWNKTKFDLFVNPSQIMLLPK